MGLLAGVVWAEGKDLDNGMDRMCLGGLMAHWSAADWLIGGREGERDE